MNEICKERTAAKVVQALEKTNLRNIEIALKLNIEANYISMIKNPSHYIKIPLKAWKKLRDFANSGETIDNYNVNKFNEFKDKPADKEDLIPKPEIKAEIKGSDGKYTLTIDLILTLNGKKIVI